MIDCHTHILPNLDDGSESLEMSVKALQQMSIGGVKAVICSSHYMVGTYKFSKDVYDARFKELEAEIRHHQIPITIYPGAEIYLTPNIADDIIKYRLTLADSNYILIETDLNGFPVDMHKNIFYLLRAGFRPILAHAERYVSVMKKTHEAKELINRNVYIQISAPSLIGGYGEKIKQTAWRLLNMGWAHFLGSDYHARSDYGAFFVAKDKIQEHIDNETMMLLTDTHPQAIIRNSKIDYEYVYVHSTSSHRTKLHI